MQSLPIYAGLLCQQVGLKFTMGGNKAWSAGGHINLPALPYSDHDAERLAYGMIMHEGGHEAHTDYQAWDAIKHDPAMANMVNRLEDIRIEKKQMERFPGAKARLQEMAKGLVARDYFRGPKDADSASTLLGMAILYELRSKVLGQEAVTEWGEQAKERLVQAIPLHLAKHLMIIAQQVVFCQNTQQVVDLAASILALMKKEKEDLEQQAQQQAASQQAQNGQGQGQQNQGQQEESNQENQGQQGQGGQGGGSNQSQQGDPSQQQPGEPTQGQSGDTENLGEQIKALSQILSGEEDAAPGDVGKMISEALTTISAEDGASIVLPQTRKSNLEIGETEQILARIRNASRALQTRVYRSFEATAKKKRAFREDGRRIDPSRLWRPKTGDYRVFVEKQEAPRVNTAVQLLVDCSGSMINQERMQPAIDAALAMATALHKLNGVKVGTATFPAVGAITGGEGEMVSVIHTFDQRPEQAAKRYAAIFSKGYTPTAEALLWAGNELIKRKEPRKIIFVLTDGIPESATIPSGVYAGVTVQVRQSLEMEGIEIIGIGIGIDVTGVFPQSARVNSLDELASRVFSVMNNALFKQAA